MDDEAWGGSACLYLGRQILPHEQDWLRLMMCIKMLGGVTFGKMQSSSLLPLSDSFDERLSTKELLGTGGEKRPSEILRITCDSCQIHLSI